MSRNDGRRENELRPVEADPHFLEQPHGVVLWSQGKTRVLCTASVKDGVPRWLHRSGRGWMTAEYSLLPASILWMLWNESPISNRWKVWQQCDPGLHSEITRSGCPLPVTSVPMRRR